jgi:hypothetical protein
VVFRIYFTAEDLARTHIADSPRPLLEANLAVRLLQERDQPARFGAWRREVLSQLPRQERMPDAHCSPDDLVLAEPRRP